MAVCKTSLHVGGYWLWFDLDRGRVGQVYFPKRSYTVIYIAVRLSTYMSKYSVAQIRSKATVTPSYDDDDDDDDSGTSAAADETCTLIV